VAVAAGLGVLIERLPGLETTLRVVGSCYLLFLAWLVLRSHSVGGTSVESPPTLRQGVAFQLVNPKAWLFAIAAVATFVPAEVHRVLGVALVTVTICAVVL